ncbi:5-formyltetrahydrofolate cyclo-ligase [Pseudoduganella armeniaca]|uniref:5-formyltetrahydrofolate cyclo-ligase n=2 Tax=Pseudoduganella armeniaca TaxID=2072590 RepID=A0A2R4CIY3_9BURK|nr:5-formyltetrahydrofolate cyclo-ligase [Pseudoduganella armeniaca]
MTNEPRIPRMPAALPPSTAQTNSEFKAALRRQLLAARRNIDAPTRAAWDADICRHIVAWWQTARVETLGVYWPLRDEPDLHPAYAELARLGVRLLLPVVLQRDAPLAFASWEIGAALVKDAMGIAVPAHQRLEAVPPALLVPCLGYNKEGYRLGYGGGFYDRTLDQLPRPATIGIAYSCLAAEFGWDGHDVPLDQLITEAG